MHSSVNVPFRWSNLEETLPRPLIHGCFILQDWTWLLKNSCNFFITFLFVLLILLFYTITVTLH